MTIFESFNRYSVCHILRQFYVYLLKLYEDSINIDICVTKSRVKSMGKIPCGMWFLGQNNFETLGAYIEPRI